MKINQKLNFSKEGIEKILKTTAGLTRSYACGESELPPVNQEPGENREEVLLPIS